MTLQFTKMHGLGNDFMVIDGIRQTVNLTCEQIVHLSRRDVGVGFDQCLLIESSTQPGVDFFYRIFNADGREIGQCGNGARCLARFAAHYQLTEKKVLTLATHTTRMQLTLHDDQQVTVMLDEPQFTPSRIPLHAKAQAPLYTLSLPGHQTCQVHAVSLGNPHAVLAVPDVTCADVQTLGERISLHSAFPEQTNVGFMQRVSPTHIRLRVYERGCGETQACGSGAAAAMAVGRLYHHLAETVTVSLPGGDLQLTWEKPGTPLYLTGPAEFVYEGRLF